MENDDYMSPSESLPDEIWQRIVLFLPIGEVILFRLVCKHFAEIVEDAHIWRELLFRDFSIPCENADYAKRNYIRCHGTAIYIMVNTNGADGRLEPDSSLIRYAPYGHKQLTVLPRPVEATASVLHNGCIYILGGLDRSYSPSDSALCYDIAGDMWKVIPPLPAPRECAVAAVVRGCVYVIGGYCRGSQSDIWRLDTKTHAEWTPVSTILNGRSAAACAVYGDKIYLMGGFSYTQLRDVDCYDPATDVWTSLTPMPRRRVRMACAVDKHYIYVVGGSDGTVLSKTLMRYDVLTDIWTTLAPLPVACYQLSACMYRGRLYVVGGVGGQEYKPLHTIWSYDPGSNMWQRRDSMPENLRIFDCVCDARNSG